MTSSATPALTEPGQASVDARRLAVYQWIVPLTRGRRVLDVGCGSGEGSAVLAAAGAREVVGLDVGGSVVELPDGPRPDGVTLLRGDPERLPYRDGSFELVVAMGPGVGWKSRDAVLDELCRVLTTDGLLLTSVEVGRRGEFREWLQRTLRREVLARQSNVLGSAIALDRPSEESQLPALRALLAPAHHPHDAREEAYLLAGVDVPDLPPVVVLDETGDAERWMESWRRQRAALERLRIRVRDLEQRLAERDQLRARLRTAQEALGARMATHEQAVQEAAWETAGNYEATVGWRLTAPLRRSGALGARVLRRR
jgi:SAM-dependent methyltransferase